MGGQLDAQVVGLPCLMPSCKQASRGGEGGENQVGGAWGRLEDGGSWQSLFSFDFVKVLKTCEPGVGGFSHGPAFGRVGVDEMNQMKVKVLSSFLYLLVSFF